MKKILLFSLLLNFLYIVSTGQKTIHDANAESRSIKDFHAIQVSNGIDLYLTKGNEEAVAVSAENAAYRDKIKTSVDNGVLKIWYENGNRHINMDWGNKKLKAYVSFKILDKLNASGGSDIKVEGSLTTDNLEMTISGGSDFDGMVDINKMSVNASGGSDIDLSGRVSNLKIDASGGSDFNGYELVAENCDVVASGGSDIHITVNKELKAHSSGGSDVFYRGNAAITDIRSNGSTIKKINK